MTQRNVGKQGWVFPLFSPDSDDRLSLNSHRFVILYISCGTRSVSLGQYCLPKVSNGFKRHFQTKTLKWFCLTSLVTIDSVGNNLCWQDPAITGISPIEGYADGGTILTITGTDLDIGRDIQVNVAANVTCDITRCVYIHPQFLWPNNEWKSIMVNIVNLPMWVALFCKTKRFGWVNNVYRRGFKQRYSCP